MKFFIPKLIHVDRLIQSQHGKGKTNQLALSPWVLRGLSRCSLREDMQGAACRWLAAGRGRVPLVCHPPGQHPSQARGVSVKIFECSYSLEPKPPCLVQLQLLNYYVFSWDCSGITSNALKKECLVVKKKNKKNCQVWSHKNNQPIFKKCWVPRYLELLHTVTLLHVRWLWGNGFAARESPDTLTWKITSLPLFCTDSPSDWE